MIPPSRAAAGRRLFVLLAVVAGCARPAAQSNALGADAAASSPRSALDDLLAADRAFSAASARTDLVSGISAMFAPDVAMPFPPARLAEGAAQATEALRATPDNARSRAEWTPVRAGVSADGTHGFTAGFMEVTRPDSSRLGLKYLAYWVKRPEGWRVAAYKRARRAPGEVSLALVPPALPARGVRAAADSAAVARFATSLDQAERAFSARAQQIGLGAAFAEFGSADAINLGSPNVPGFVVGADAIGRLVGEGAPTTSSPVSWWPDRVIVAPSGDLGVTIGTIKRNEAPAEGPATVPFFTIWRRASPSAPWRYVAE